jgi:hypothetical protein
MVQKNDLVVCQFVARFVERISYICQLHSKPKVGEITTVVGKNRYNHKKVGSLTTKNGPHTHKSS